MDTELRLIIQAIVAETRPLGHPDNSLDNLCHELSIPKLNGNGQCNDCECTNCFLGYKDYQYYSNQIVKVWRQL